MTGQLNSTGSGAASESGDVFAPPVRLLTYASDESYILDNDGKELGSGVADESGAVFASPVGLLKYARDESYISENDEKYDGLGVAPVSVVVTSRFSRLHWLTIINNPIARTTRPTAK